MNTKKKPLPVIAMACLYLAVGSMGIAMHFHAALAHPHEGFWIELTEALAIVCGIWLLRGQNWARWLALAWMAFHVIRSAFGPVHELAIHTVIFALIAWALFYPEATRYFRKQEVA